MDLKGFISSYVFRESNFGASGRTPSPDDPSVLVFSDIDDTFVPWKRYGQVADVDKLGRTKETLKQYEGKTINGLCSARGLSQIQQLAPFFKGVPLQFIGTNGGQQVYINSQNQPAEEWLTSLKVHDSDNHWDNEVARRSGGFNTQLVMRATHSVLNDFGFERCAVPLPPPHHERDAFVAAVPGGKNGEVAVVALTKDQTTLMFRADFKDVNKPLTPAHKDFARKLARKLEERLTKQGVSLNAKRFVDQKCHQIYLIEPTDISKESLVSHLVRRYPSVQAVITAGDNTNDTMLLPNSFLGVPNHRIVSGDRPEVAQVLDGQENVERVPFGELSPGLNSHLSMLLADDKPVD
ncbi:hypothetical protein ABS71_04355 [bacterium SCN 62-11]|nr:hypothetical protein [Candidatus Eremiobacteraeota bacterium]ODT75493.1 MAG: hypothetical protein ABS71_04355 [bacterium SCN 62-11]